MRVVLLLLLLLLGRGCAPFFLLLPLHSYFKTMCAFARVPLHSEKVAPLSDHK